MAQAAPTQSNVGEIECKLELKTHLSKHNVPDHIYTLLQNDSITMSLLLTFTNDDLKDWCNEHNLKIVERRKFMNAIKELPNADANKSQFVFVGNEEKEQMSQFESMKENINNIIKNINQINTQKNINAATIINEINTVCDQLNTLVDNLRTTLLQTVCCVYEPLWFSFNSCDTYCWLY